MSEFGRLWALLTRQQRYFAVGLFLMALVGTVLEMVGLGLVVPLVGLLTLDNIGAVYPSLQSFFDIFGDVDREYLVFITLMLLISAYVVKTVFMTLQAWLSASFNLRVQASISRELFAYYLQLPWLVFSERNKSRYVQNVHNEVQILIQQGYGSAIEIVVNILLLFFSAIFLLILAPVATLVIGLMVTFFFFIFQYLSKVRVSHWGRIRQEHEALRLTCLQQGLRSVKDIRLRSCENFFTDQFNKHSLSLIYSGCWQSTLRKFPKYVFELVAVSGLVIAVIMMIFSGTSLNAIVPVIGLFAAIFIKLLPAVNAILTGLHSIRYISPTIEMIFSELRRTERDVFCARDDDTGGWVCKASVVLQDVTFKYPKAEENTLDHLCLEVPFGQALGIVGVSGAGKSTLIDIILGFLQPDSGRFLYGGEDVSAHLFSWQSQIGYVPQSIYLLDDTLRRNIAFGIRDEDIDEEAVLQAVRDAQLEELVQSLPEGLDTVVGDDGGRLSGGQKQRVGLARALYRHPLMLVLDEATASLDPCTEAEVMDAVMRLKGRCTILIVTHRYSTIAGCDAVVKIEGGGLQAVEPSFLG